MQVCTYGYSLMAEGVLLRLRLRAQGLGFHRVHQEAELVTQRLVSVGHADLRHVGAPDVVPFGSVFQVVGPEEVLFLLLNKNGSYNMPCITVRTPPDLYDRRIVRSCRRTTGK